jgi:ABC-type microcin C transport system permease subunit YejE
MGVPHRRILLRHVLPNSITPVIVQVSLDVGGVILTACSQRARHGGRRAGGVSRTV